MKILITGAAGFIGHYCAATLLASGHVVVGVDSMNDYYDPALKRARLARLSAHDAFSFHRMDISAPGALRERFSDAGFTHVLHLAAQAGVRYSLEAPRAYIDANLAGHLEVLELVRHSPTIVHCVYASSSSVYGERADAPFSEADVVRHPVSLYAATKIGGEMLSESYARLYGLSLTGLRFFTVYGRWGRPDMAYWIFTEKILRGEPITLFAPDEMQRDFTHVDDISGVMETILNRPGTGHTLYNLGNNTPVALMDFVREIETACGVTAKLDILPRQPGDVSLTSADITRAADAFGFSPDTPIGKGLPDFVAWYREWADRT